MEVGDSLFLTRHTAVPQALCSVPTPRKNHFPSCFPQAKSGNWGAERVRVLGEAVLLCINSLAPSCAEAALEPGESLPCGRRHTRISACNMGADTKHRLSSQIGSQEYVMQEGG